MGMAKTSDSAKALSSCGGIYMRRLRELFKHRCPNRVSYFTSESMAKGTLTQKLQISPFSS